MNRDPVSVDLGLQGGGAHGAFTWGVLDRLLEESWLQFDGISGTSAGAMNAAVMADGLTEGGPPQARVALEQFWRRVSDAALLSPLRRGPLEILAGTWTLDYSPVFAALDVASRMLSPYDINPMDSNPLRQILADSVDFDRVASLVLGPFWRDASVQQREGFRREFKAMLIHTYASALNKLSEWEIRYPPMHLEPGQRDLVVPTEILRDGAPPVEVSYRMAFDGARWRAYDVSVEGVSLLTNYRSTFVRMARQKGLDGLIQDLAQRNATRGAAAG